MAHFHHARFRNKFLCRVRGVLRVVLLRERVVCCVCSFYVLCVCVCVCLSLDPKLKVLGFQRYNARGRGFHFTASADEAP